MPSRARSSIWAVILIAAGSVALALFIRGRLIAADLPISWDEAAHSLFGVLIAQDIRQCDLASFAYDTYRQVYWPPLHSWIVGSAFVLFGESISVARDVTLIAYGLLPVALFGAGFAMGERNRVWRATAAGVLGLVLPAFMPFAAIAFLDLPALLALTLTLLAAFVAERFGDRPRWRAAIALGVLVTFFLKTNYGLLLIAVFAADALIDAGGRPLQLLTRRNGWLFGPIAIALGLWLAYPPKIVATLNAMINTPTIANLWSMDALLFYPRTVRTFAGSVPMLFLLLAGVGAAWPGRHQRNTRVLLLLAATQLLLGELHHTKEDRHLLPIMPPLILLVADMVARLAGRPVGSVDADARSFRWWWLAGFGLLCAFQLVITLRHPVLTPWAEQPVRLGAAHSALLDELEKARAVSDRVLIIGAFDLSPGPTVIDWDLVVRRRLLGVERAGAIAAVDQDRKLARLIGRTPFPSLLAGPVLRASKRFDEPEERRTLYAGLPRRLSPNEFAQSVGETVTRAEIRRVILITNTDDRAMYSGSYFAPAVAALTKMSERVIDGSPPTKIEVWGTPSTREIPNSKHQIPILAFITIRVREPMPWP